MPRLLLDNCCCCVDLKRGCTIIGYVEMAMEISLGVKQVKSIWQAGSVLANAEPDYHESQKAIGAIVLATIMLCLLVVMLGFTMALLHGLEKNKRGPVKAYFICGVIFVVATVVLCAVILSLQPDRENIIEIGFIGFRLLLTVYFLLVIRSYYYKMEEFSKEAIETTS